MFDYTNLYLDHKIEFTDIPLVNYTTKILSEAAVRNGMEYVDAIFKLYEVDKDIDLLVFAKFIQEDTPAYYEMYKRIFELDPEKYFSVLPSKCLSSFVYEKLLLINFDKYVDLIPIQYISPKLCEYIYQKSPEKLFKYMYLHYGNGILYRNLLSLEMCLKLIELDAVRFFNNAYIGYLEMVVSFNPEKYFPLVPESRKIFSICEKMFEINPEKYFPLIPEEMRTIEMCEKMFKLDAEKYFSLIPSSIRTSDMCIKMFDVNPEKYFLLIPEEMRTAEMCKKILEISVEKYFEFIPKKYRTKDLYIKCFKKAPSLILEILPAIYRTQDIYLKFYKIDPILTFRNMPNKFKTEEMCNEYFKYDSIRFHYFIPKSLYTKEMYKVLLKRDFKYYAKIISDDKVDVDIISIAKIEMDRMLENGEMFENKRVPKLVSIIVKLYPEYNKIFYVKKPTYSDNELIIRNELYSLINNGGKIKDITYRFGIASSVVKNVLEKIAIEDSSAYIAIKSVLESNQKGYFFNMINNVKRLSLIIKSIGNIDRNGLTLDQKLKFAYLCNKHLMYNLEDIYSFDYKKYCNEDFSEVTRFFNRVLKYSFIKSENIPVPEKKTILFNNGWLKNYNRDKFFAIKNDVPTIERKYGKDGQLLTLEIEEKIINILKTEGIPLNEIIVATAFKEYFYDNLAMYIEKIKSYDIQFNDILNKGVSR